MTESSGSKHDVVEVELVDGGILSYLIQPFRDHPITLPIIIGVLLWVILK